MQRRNPDPRTRAKRVLLVLAAAVGLLVVSACDARDFTPTVALPTGVQVGGPDGSTTTAPVTTSPSSTLPVQETTTTTAPAPTTTTTKPVTTTTAPPTTTPATSNKPAVPADGTLFGLWENPGPGNWSQAGIKGIWNQRVGEIGRNPDIAHNFYTFTETWPSWRETWHIDQGRTPMVSWEGTSSSKLADGTYDAEIRQRADGAKALGVPIFLRFFWEPDAQKKLNVSESPEAYVAAWRHVHDVFQAEGVDNVAWVWCPTAYAFKDGRADAYYPGDAYVDWVCSDGYNWSTTQDNGKWRDFRTIYTASYQFAQAHQKPMIVGEYGTLEGTPGQKADWFRTARSQIKQYFPGIKALVYFDSNRQEAGVWRDWRIDTSPDSLTAFREMAQDPYFNR